jgi:hypothetical protein
MFLRRSPNGAQLSVGVDGVIDEAYRLRVLPSVARSPSTGGKKCERDDDDGNAKHFLIGPSFA